RLAASVPALRAGEVRAVDVPLLAFRHLHALVVFLDGHQRGHVAPQKEAAKGPAGSTDPRLRTLHVLDHQRDMPPRRLASLALEAEAGIEQGRQLLAV